MDSFWQTDGLKWTASWILAFSMFFTYCISSLGTPRPEILRVEPKNRLARARQWKAAKRAQRELEERRRRIWESGRPFPFLVLPPEISLLILGHCAEWNAAYTALVRVSREMQGLAFQACLPRIPIVLKDKEQVRSFADLLLLHPEVEGLVRQLWIEPEVSRGESRMWCIAIMQRCRNVRALACSTLTLEEAIGRGPVFGLAECRDLTLLFTSNEHLAKLLKVPAAGSFLHRLTHLRVHGEMSVRVPAFQFASLTHLSYADYGAGLSDRQQMVRDRYTYPTLQTVVVTKQRGAGGLRISRCADADARVFNLEVPDRWTETEMWTDGARGRGIWDLCTT